LIEVNKNTHSVIKKIALTLNNISPTFKIADLKLKEKYVNEDAMKNFLNDELCISHKYLLLFKFF
jgi:hypothetical protein